MLVLQALGTLMGVLLVWTALRAWRTGAVAGPARYVKGHYEGMTLIRRAERPAAFWLCVLALLAFGWATLAAVWLLL